MISEPAGLPGNEVRMELDVVEYLKKGLRLSAIQMVRECCGWNYSDARTYVNTVAFKHGFHSQIW